MNKLFTGFGKKNLPKKESIIIVSGLPRSGTSMMMKILAEAGVPIVTDELRRADTDNPNGYYELEAAKQLSAGNLTWLSEAGGRAVKVILSLLEYLPAQYSYKIIFMEREIKEILASRQKMLKRRSEESKATEEELETRFREHLKATKYWLARQPNMHVMYVDYNKLMADPDDQCQPIADFLSVPLDVSRMRSVPNDIDHVHFHLVPRSTGDGVMGWPKVRPYAAGEMETVRSKLANALS